ncbi:NfeD family protein [Propionibacterium sp.]|uniref:NfeD family protein n=1 Tax=Propionibacterium sp. TaxID=1977903 RepID=UPI0039E7DECC
MNDWLRDYGWAAWMAAGAVLGVCEFLTTEMTLLMLASGAIAGGLVALAFPHLFWLQIIIAILVAWVMLAFLRPTLLRKVRNSAGYRSSLDKIVGAPGVALSQITPTGGEAKISGDTWTARSIGGVIESGTDIEVFEIDGAIAVVYPRNGPLTWGETQ